MATNASAASSHPHPHPHPHPQHSPSPSSSLSQHVARPLTISRRQFGPAPGSRPSSTLLTPAAAVQPTPPAHHERHPTPPPRPSPPSRPVSTISSSGSGGSPNAQGTVAPSVACPICNIGLRNLAQLNQHLDAVHPEEPDDVKFANAQKVLNPITKTATITLKNIPANSSELLRKIQDLDIDSAGPNSLAGPPPPGAFQGWTDPRADAVVTRRHWIRESDRDVCFQPGCDRGLGIRVIYSRTTDFLSTRVKSAEKKHLAVNRLEKRIEKLAQIHQQYESGTSSSLSSSTVVLSPTPSRSSVSSVSSGTGSVRKGLFRSVTSKGQLLKMAEQSIVKWEDDSTIPGCYICLSVFNRYGNRKHHCRLCGRVMCDNCSMNTPLYLNMSTYPDGSDAVGHTRACKECVHTVFKRREHAADQKRPNAVLKYYDSLMRLKARIDLALPLFQEMIASLGQKADIHQAHPDYQVASRTRKELLDDFALFDSISKKIARLPAHSQHQKQLHNNLHWWATQYLQTNMFPLSVIPKVFGHSGGHKEQKSNGNNASPALSSSPAPSITLSAVPETSQDNEAAIETLAQLAVMEEQRQLVESYIEEATKKRKLDDVASLKMSLGELEREMAALRSGKR
ncbi:carboxypeptidase Y-deficient [Dissophora globulifera]|nr:carboxypeptidase Y-deficient [Dissophora globulifera]